MRWRLLPPALALLAGVSARVVAEALVPSAGGGARLLAGARSGSRSRRRRPGGGGRRLRYLPL